MNEVKYKLNREWLNELLKHKTNSNVYFSLSDNDIRILLTCIEILQSKIDKANELLDKYSKTEVEDYEKIIKFYKELRNALKEEK